MFQYSHPGIKPRAKGQRYDKHLLGALGDFSNCRGVPATATVRQVGTSMAYQGFAATKSTCWLFEVTLECGTVVPCYSFSPLGSNGYMICQSFTHKAFVPAKQKSLAKAV